MIDPDKVRGVLYGQAIGDALGIPDEGKSAAWIRAKYGAQQGQPVERPLVYRAGEPYKGSRFEAGEWSDDTEMALLMLETFLEQRREGWLVDPREQNEGWIVVDSITRKSFPIRAIAKAFRGWLVSDGRGSGRTTRNVICDAGFLTDPHDAALRVWLRGGRRAAPNGALMRTSTLGLLHPDKLRWTELIAVDAAKITHHDPRCVASSVALSCAIAVLVTGGSVDEALDEACARAAPYHEEAPRWIRDKTFDDLCLDEGLDEPGRAPIGYTYKCLGAAFWALREIEALQLDEWQDPALFVDVLKQILLAGGDVDTNAAVAGAILGARVGFKAIHQAEAELITGLVHAWRLETALQELQEIHLDPFGP